MGIYDVGQGVLLSFPKSGLRTDGEREILETFAPHPTIQTSSDSLCEFIVADWVIFKLQMIIFCTYILELEVEMTIVVYGDC